MPFFVVVLVADQVTKYIALSTLMVGMPVPVLGDFLRWTLTYNPGGAFGMRLGSSTYYLISSLIIFVILIVYIWRNRNISHIAIPLTIVSGGAVGNIIDRIRFGKVIDFIDCEFIDIHIGSYHMERWPIFNVADMAVSCGIIATILLILWHSRKSPEETPVASETSDPPTSSEPQGGLHI
jgi:signal peptidase II